jgi:hypothetical protein
VTPSVELVEASLQLGSLFERVMKVRSTLRAAIEDARINPETWSASPFGTELATILGELEAIPSPGGAGELADLLRATLVQLRDIVIALRSEVELMDAAIPLIVQATEESWRIERLVHRLMDSTATANELTKPAFGTEAA